MPVYLLHLHTCSLTHVARLQCVVSRADRGFAITVELSARFDKSDVHDLMVGASFAAFSVSHRAAHIFTENSRNRIHAPLNKKKFMDQWLNVTQNVLIRHHTSLKKPTA